MIFQQLANSLALGSVYVLVALGLYLVFNTLHIPNFAHGEMFALGAFMQWWLVTQLKVPFLIALPLVVAVTAVLGAIVYLGVFRRLQKEGIMAMFLGSLAMAFMLQEIIGLTWGKDPLGMSEPVSGVADLGGVRIANYRLVILAVTVIIAVVLGFILFKTTFGRELRALAQNSEMARLSGINVTRVATSIFAMGAAVAGLAGGLLAPTTSLNPHMGFHMTLVSFVIVTVVGAGGGMGMVIASGFILATLETITVAYLDGGLRTGVVFLVLVVFLILKPEGASKASNALKVKL